MNIVDLAVAHAQQGHVASYVLAFAAGIVTSVGPCVAPRYGAVAAMAGSAGRAGWLRLFAFALGTVVAYMAVACLGSVVMRLVQASSVIYWILAAALVLSGLVQLLRAPDHACGKHRASVPSYGGAFFLGAATSTTLSPCCTPILIALGALTATPSAISGVVALVIAFTIGHIAPILALLGAAGALERSIIAHRGAVATVAAAVTIALGCYYAVLA